jgi:hypothetical protein
VGAACYEEITGLVHCASRIWRPSHLNLFLNMGVCMEWPKIAGKPMSVCIPTNHYLNRTINIVFRTF